MLANYPIYSVHIPEHPYLLGHQHLLVFPVVCMCWGKGKSNYINLSYVHVHVKEKYLATKILLNAVEPMDLQVLLGYQVGHGHQSSHQVPTEGYSSGK